MTAPQYVQMWAVAANGTIESPWCLTREDAMQAVQALAEKEADLRARGFIVQFAEPRLFTLVEGYVHPNSRHAECRIVMRFDPDNHRLVHEVVKPDAV